MSELNNQPLNSNILEYGSCLIPLKLRQYLTAIKWFKNGLEALFWWKYVKQLRQIDVHLHDGLDVVSACRKAGISDKSYYYWRKKFGGLSRSQVSEMKSLKKENERLKKIVADLQLEKVILKESLDFQISLRTRMNLGRSGVTRILAKRCLTDCLNVGMTH